MREIFPTTIVEGCYQCEIEQMHALAGVEVRNPDQYCGEKVYPVYECMICGFKCVT